MVANGVDNLHQLSNMSGVKYTTVFAMFKDTPEKISIPTIQKLCMALHCTSDYLLFGDTVNNEIIAARTKWDSMTAVQRAEIIGVLKYVKQSEGKK